MALHKQNGAPPRSIDAESQSSGPSPSGPSRVKDGSDLLAADFEEKLRQTLRAFKLKAAKEVAQDLPKITGKLIERSTASLEALAASSCDKLREEFRAAQAELNEGNRNHIASLSEEAARSFHVGLAQAAEAAATGVARGAEEQAGALARNADAALRSILTASDEAAARLQNAQREIESSLRLDHEKRTAELAAAGQNAGGALQAVEAAAQAASAKLQAAREQLEASLLSDLQERLAEVSALRAAEFERRAEASVAAVREQAEGEIGQLKRKAAASIEGDLTKASAELLQSSAERLRRQTDEAREGLLAELQKSGAAVLEQTERQLASFQKESSHLMNQSAKAAAETAVREAARTVEEQAKDAIRRESELAAARIEAEQQKLQTRAELSVADHQKHLLQLSVQGVESIQRQLDGRLDAFRGQLQTSVEALEQRALEKAAGDFPKVSAKLLDDAAVRLQKAADEAAAGVKETLKSSAAAHAEEARLHAVEEARDSLRLLREGVMEQTRTQIQQWLKDSAAGRRKEFEAEIEAAFRKQRKSTQQQMDETCRAGLERLQQASANVASVQAPPQPSSASRWVLVLIALIPTILFLYLMNRPVMRLKAEAPAEFLNAYPEWTAQHQDVALKLGEAYWDWAALRLTRDYPYGAELPEQPPVSFEVSGPGFPSGVEADVARTRYWNKLREMWKNPQSWTKVDAWNRH